MSIQFVELLESCLLIPAELTCVLIIKEKKS